MNYGRRHNAKGVRSRDKLMIACRFPDWMFNFFNEKAKDQSKSFNAALIEFLEEAVEIDLECQLDEIGLHDIADMDDLKMRFHNL